MGNLKAYVGRKVVSLVGRLVQGGWKEWIYKTWLEGMDMDKTMVVLRRKIDCFLDMIAMRGENKDMLDHFLVESKPSVCEV